ncbi:hypothetical protein [Aurantiacibacter flavus]|uniref:Cytochrome c domain-containing protein n=1 Tax=Aurantiacibacter flavus TaxID=3145232 RepID=A0ABV0CYE0_9SPHN
MIRFPAFRTSRIALLPLLTLAACSSEQEPADLAYGTVQQMMANEVQPTADVYWGAVRFESRLEPDGSVTEEEFEPKTDAEWEQVAEAARKLQSFAVELQTQGYAEGRGEDWLVFAKGLDDVSKKAEQAALDKDPDAVFEVGGTVYNVCSACHQMYPPAELETAAGDAQSS